MKKREKKCLLVDMVSIKSALYVFEYFGFILTIFTFAVVLHGFAASPIAFISHKRKKVVIQFLKQT